MRTPYLAVLPSEHLDRLHQATLRILGGTGLRVPLDVVLDRLEGHPDLVVDRVQQTVRFKEAAVERALSIVPHAYSVFGRDRTRALNYGGPTFHSHATDGQTHWVEPDHSARRPAEWSDFELSVRVADALPMIDLVGAMVEPSGLHPAVSGVRLLVELLKRTRKPVRSFIYHLECVPYVLEILSTLAGGGEALRQFPRFEYGLEPISPLTLPREGLEIALAFAAAGVPITLGPMPQAMATAPTTLAGAVVLGNAEVLGSIVILQSLAPGVPVKYNSSPHIMDPRTMNISFGSPEQAIMGAAATLLAKKYGLPAGVNVGISDAKLPDAQAGMEKAATMLVGAIAGADMFGAMGIAGMDQGFSLPQLIIDDEIIAYVKRIMRGMSIDEDAIAAEVIERVGIGGNFLTDDHTLAHWKDEVWRTTLCDRDLWEPWRAAGGKTMHERAMDRMLQIASQPSLEEIEAGLGSELDAIAAAAERQLIPGTG